MNLNELKPRGYHLSDVEPNFRGMPLKEWLSKKITSQFEAFIAQPDKVKAWAGNLGDRKWAQRAVATPRDNYGWKSI